jgi:hypothetical protein
MKKIIGLTLVLAILISCDSAEKALQRGSYEQACYMAVKKLQKKPDDSEHAEILTVAYQKANQADLDRIEYLKLSGEEHGWDEIYKLYSKLESRQTYVETVLPLRAGGKTVNFEHINYNAKILEAKTSAADFHYNKGMELMNGDKEQIRLAYDHLVQAKEYKASYPDIDRKILDAKEKGTSFVLVSPLNKTYAQLTPEFLGHLVDFSMSKLDDKWIRFYNTPQIEFFDYTVFVAVNSIYVSPDDKKEEKEIIKKDVKDGYQYEYDSKGNVKKDSLGNDVKVPKYKTISCTLTKKTQTKFCVLKVSIEIQDNRAKRIVNTSPEEVRYNFEYTSANANGDLNALDDATRKLLNNNPIAFPDDMTMIQYCSDKLQPKIEENIRINKRFIK